MSYTATIERKRRCAMYRGSDSFRTDTKFAGQAVRGTLSLTEWGHCDDIDLGLAVHVQEESQLVAETVEGTYRDFVAVEIATHLSDGVTLNNAEALVFMSHEQARALRDSLNALDI